MQSLWLKCCINCEVADQQVLMTVYNQVTILLISQGYLKFPKIPWDFMKETGVLYQSRNPRSSKELCKSRAAYKNFAVLQNLI